MPSSVPRGRSSVNSGPLVRAVYFGQVMNAASARSAALRRAGWLGAMAAAIGAIVLGVGWNLYKQKRGDPLFRRRSVSRPRLALA